VGSYAITVVDAGTLSAANYDFPAANFVNGSLAITPANLTVTANNVSRPVGTANNLTYTITGFRNGQTVATSDVTGLPTLSTSATTLSPANPYPITITGGIVPTGLSSHNYTFSFVNGTLTVTTNYGWLGFLQPINDTNHSQYCPFPCTMSVFKAGSTVPVKFQLRDASGNLLPGPASPMPLWLTPAVAGAAHLQVDETVYQDAPSSGSTLTYDPTSQSYQYNWKSPKTPGVVYQLGVQLPDGSKEYVTIGLG